MSRNTRGEEFWEEVVLSVIELSKCADLAMYRVKQQGRNACRLFQEEMLEPDTESEPPL